ncbi:probable N-acetyltransferase 16 [Rana temporaria]|uniref:probable N-acetyltransferase 16 n=1 Tax=Rana temporaria TaxID=8407 RepID=UPI001AAD7D7F|nr:probable N-acetyltransferase 16 [Rana temporaria]
MPESPTIDFVPATAEDYEELMSISSGIYKGVDYLPYSYHAWLKDRQRGMYMAKIEGKIVGFESFLLVDSGETAVVQSLRVAPWMRGKGLARIFIKFLFDKIHSDHPQVKRIRFAHEEDPLPSMLKKYKVITSKAVVSMILPSDQIEEAIRLLEARLDNVGQLNNYTVLEPAEVLKLFDGTKTSEDLLPGGLLIQGWLPITTQRSNLEMLFERKITWIYSQPQNTSGSAEQQQTNHEGKMRRGSPSLSPSSVRFLSLGTPAYPVLYTDATYLLDIDLFGIDPASAKIHVVQQLKLCIQSLPAGNSIICNVYGEESLRAELSQLQGGLMPFLAVNEQMVLEMDL